MQDDPEYLLHLDFESGHFHSGLPLRLRLYNSVFDYRHRRVVLSVPVLLSPAADSPQWNGLLQRGLPGEEPISTLRYQVVRVWQLPVEQVLHGGIGTLALAPITNVAAGDVRRVISRKKERLGGPQPPRRAADVWAATYFLLGLRYIANAALLPRALSHRRLISCRFFHPQDLLKDGLSLLLLMGETKYGPDAQAQAQIEGITDLAQLEELGVRLVKAGTWEELLAGPAARRRNRGRSRR